MRGFGLGILGMVVLAAAPACAHGGKAQHSVPPPAVRQAGAIPAVSPGEQIAIACNVVDAHADSDVRVVMRLAQVRGENNPGYRAVVATNEKLMDGSVRIRVPTMPGLTHHTVHLKVYVVGRNGAQTCDAGFVKIV